MENLAIIQRLDALKAARSNIQAKWEEIDRYILPLEQGSFAAKVTNENAKNWDTLDVWDSTAPIGAERLNAMLHSSLLAGRWFGGKFLDPRINKTPAFKSWMDNTTDRAFDAIMSSNFEVAMAQAMREWAGYGNGAITRTLVSEDSWEGMDFRCTPVKGLFFEESWDGKPYRTFEPIMWTATQILSKFRDKNDPSKPDPRIPEKILKAESGSQAASERHEVIFAIYPRDGAKPMAWDEKARAPELRPFAWKYVLREGAITLDEGGFYEMPKYVGRWAVTSSSQWGYGPSLLALPTVKLLNALQETVVNAGAKAVDPASLVSERGLLSDLDLSPGGQTVVRDPQKDVVILESKARWDVSEGMLASHQNMVRKHFREDDIQLKDGAMTATEVNRRFVLLNRFLSPPVKQIQHDMLAPTVQDTIASLARMDQLEPPPQEYVQMKPRPKMQVVFFGPLMTAQRDDEVAAIERLLAAKAAMTKMDPGSPAKHVVKDDVALREMAERLATPGAMLASEQEVKAAGEQEKKLAQQMAQAQVQKTAAEGNRAQAGAQQMMGEMQNGQ